MADAGGAGIADVFECRSVGFALEDFSALRMLRDFAAELGVGQAVALVPEMQDPKNLFGELGQPARAARPAARPLVSMAA